MQCLSLPQLSVPPSLCCLLSEVRCSPIVTLEQVRLSPPACGKRAMRSGAVCRFSCRRGYRLLGNPEVRCLPTGDWSNNINKVTCTGIRIVCVCLRESERETLVVVSKAGKCRIQAYRWFSRWSVFIAVTPSWTFCVMPSRLSGNSSIIMRAETKGFQHGPACMACHCLIGPRQNLNKIDGFCFLYPRCPLHLHINLVGQRKEKTYAHHFERFRGFVRAYMYNPVFGL